MYREYAVSYASPFSEDVWEARRRALLAVAEAELCSLIAEHAEERAVFLARRTEECPGKKDELLPCTQCGLLQPSPALLFAHQQQHRADALKAAKRASAAAAVTASNQLASRYRKLQAQEWGASLWLLLTSHEQEREGAIAAEEARLRAAMTAGFLAELSGLRPREVTPPSDDLGDTEMVEVTAEQQAEQQQQQQQQLSQQPSPPPEQPPPPAPPPQHQQQQQQSKEQRQLEQPSQQQQPPPSVQLLLEQKDRQAPTGRERPRDC